MPLELIFFMVLLSVGVIVLFVFFLKRTAGQNERLLLQAQIHALSQQTSERIDQLRIAIEKTNTEMTKAMSGTSQNVGERLDKAAEVIRDVSSKLARLDESSKRIFDVGKSISGLEKVLRAPKLRGSLGELFLHDLLAQILPPEYYHMQHTFSGGDTVDAVIRLETGMVPVDAKFPLENFKRFAEAENDQQCQEAQKAFIRDVKKHIDAIASKYIRADEGTLDFALMYIPAENVYYQAIIKEDTSTAQTSLFSYALDKRCIPVSPNSFYAYLQTILLGLKGLRVEESAREIINNLARLKKELQRFENDFLLVGKHIENANKKYLDAGKRFVAVGNKLEQMEGLTGEIPSQAPSTLPTKTTAEESAERI